MQKMELNAGNTIFKKGDPADGLYIVGKGSVGIYFPTNQTMEKPDIVLKAIKSVKILTELLNKRSELFSVLIFFIYYILII